VGVCQLKKSGDLIGKRTREAARQQSVGSKRKGEPKSDAMTGNVNVGAPNPISGREGSLQQSSRQLITTLQCRAIRQGACKDFSLFHQQAIHSLRPLGILLVNGDNYEEALLLERVSSNFAVHKTPTSDITDSSGKELSSRM
jgi:hypothetical protein